MNVFFSETFCKPPLVNKRCKHSNSQRSVESARASLIISLDGDGLNDSADIVSFINTYNEKSRQQANRLLIGHRRQRQDSSWRQFSSKVPILCVISPRVMIPLDSGCGSKPPKREMFKKTSRHLTICTASFPPSYSEVADLFSCFL